MMRLSWGTRIFLLYTGFVAMIVFLVFRSTSEKIDLVAPDYYRQELAFQEKLDQMNRANELDVQPTWVVEKNAVVFSFPENMNDAKGEICFFKPSDKYQDVKIKIGLKDGKQVVPVSKLKHGAYKLQLSWELNEVKYFREGVIFIDK